MSSLRESYSAAGDFSPYSFTDEGFSSRPGTTPLPSAPFDRAGFNTRRSSAGLPERSNNFKVVIRIRPPLQRELQGENPFQNVAYVEPSGQVIHLSENPYAGNQNDGATSPSPPPGVYASHTFTFDHVYDQFSSQQLVYDSTAKPVVTSSLEGYNATIFAYGQTGTGKTYTMEGGALTGRDPVEERGIIPRAIEQIFNFIETNVAARKRFLVRASYLQIYNEQISDLLKPERVNLAIREDKKKGVFVEGLSEWVVRSPAEIYGLMQRGAGVRATGSTKMNELSSRSHAVFIIIVEQSETHYVDDQGNDLTAEQFAVFMNTKGPARDKALAQLESHVRQSFKVGKLNLVDLAGSERVRLSGATGQRLEESKKINQSLSALGNVIAALTDTRSRQHIPYRDSKLTRILEDSLGGNCKTTMMAMISPALEAMQESLSTLKFANRAKNIKNEARINEDLDQKSLLRKYERELKRLRAELDEKSKNVVDKRRLLELDEQRRRAEEDKMVAIRALEQRSLEFMREKEEKRKLEERIAMLTSQMLSSTDKYEGGGSIANEGTARNNMKDQQDHIRKAYESKLAELERERETIEEEKAQVDRYKQLLLKQRDIMIALTQRLNERDEQIMMLQDELDVYDRHQRQLEEKLDEKTAQLIHLQRVLIEKGAGQAENVDIDLRDRQEGAHNGPPSRVPQEVEPIGLYNDQRQGSGGKARGEAAKIAELQSQLDSQASEQARLVKELEDLRTEKVALEQFIRDRRDRMGGASTPPLPPSRDQGAAVDPKEHIAELSARVHVLTRQYANLRLETSGQLQEKEDALTRERDAVQRLKEEMVALKSTLEGERGQGVRQSETMDGQQNNTEVKLQQLDSRCSLLVKERKAMQVIMENKIKTMVSAIAQVSQEMASAPGGLAPPHLPRLLKEVGALQRLVNAAVVALQNAEKQDSSRMAAVDPKATGLSQETLPGSGPLRSKINLLSPNVSGGD